MITLPFFERETQEVRVSKDCDSDGELAGDRLDELQSVLASKGSRQRGRVKGVASQGVASKREPAPTEVGAGLRLAEGMGFEPMVT